MVDKGYQELKELLRALHRVKERPHEPPLSFEELQYNRNLSASQIIVELVLWRLQSLRNRTKDCYREDYYNLYFRQSLVFKNYHVIVHHLRRYDCNEYQRWTKEIYYEAMDKLRTKHSQRNNVNEKYKIRSIFIQKNPKRSSQEPNTINVERNPKDTTIIQKSTTTKILFRCEGHQEF